MVKFNKKFVKNITKELSNLFKSFYYRNTSHVNVECIDFYNAYCPENGDEVITYRYKFHIVIDDTLYVYNGWCYIEDLSQVAIGIFSHWLLNNYKIYDGPSTAWYNMFTCQLNLVSKEKI